MLDSSENSNKHRYIYRFIKRVFDMISSLLLFIVISPLLLIVAISIKIDSKGPVLFKHKRIGYHGKEIYLYKFRSMVVNAEDLIKSFTPDQQREWKENYKLENDPRVTRVGKFIRKTSIDELPQLLNIIGGSLSVVGPRPVIGEELDKYGNNKEKLLSVKPGLTGYWASHGRSNTSYDERMSMELYYVDNASISLDIRILFKTVISVFKKEGAR